MPDFYVFPGGRLDPADYRIKPLTPLRPEVHEQLSRSGGARQAQALAVAAARETYEETGLALGEPDSGAAGKLRPALAPLDYVLRAITPPSSPIRFHARFFAVEARHVGGNLKGNGELLDLDWRPIDECLRLPVADVTEFLLRRWRADEALGAKEKGERLAGVPRREGVPLFCFRNGVARVR